MLRDPRFNSNTMVMHNLRDYFIREGGRTLKVQRSTVEGRFGKLIAALTLEFPCSWIDLDDDPRAELATLPQLTPITRTVNQVDWSQWPATSDTEAPRRC